MYVIFSISSTCQKGFVLFFHQVVEIKKNIKKFNGFAFEKVCHDHMWLTLCRSRNHRQGLYKSWKTWKVMEFMISISRPGKSLNSSEGHGKSWKSNLFLDNKRY